MPSLNEITTLQYVGLLTDKQKRAGYVSVQDADFIYVLHAEKPKHRVVAIFEYETATVKWIREIAEQDYRETHET